MDRVGLKGNFVQTNQQATNEGDQVNSGKKLGITEQSQRVGMASIAKSSVDALQQRNGPEADLSKLPSSTQAMLRGAERGRSAQVGALLVTASEVERVLQCDELLKQCESLPQLLHPFVRQLAEALKHSGPLGSRAPLGPDGPLGQKAWNPSYWMQLFGSWSGLSKDLAKVGGPGSELGPLGSYGPASKQSLELLLKSMGPMAAELNAGGLFTALGPLGPLGALGALGYLGKVGGHGFVQDKNGHFVDDAGGQQRTTSVEYQGQKRSYELVELYSEAQADQLGNNDSSWMIRGTLAPGDKEDTFAFTSAKEQLITLTAVPENGKDIFTLELLDDQGKVIAESNSKDLVNWIQIGADEARNLQVRVRREETASQKPSLVNSYIDTMLMPLKLMSASMKPWLGQSATKESGNFGYRLVATGSNQQVNQELTSGPHQQRFCWLK